MAFQTEEFSEEILHIDSLNLDIEKNNIKDIKDLSYYKNILVEEKKKLYENEKLLNKDISNIENLAVIKCKEIYGEHEWHRERESGLYGELLIYCARCGKDKYNSYIHKI